MSDTSFANLDELAAHLRQELENKTRILLYAYNGTGKTRLSMAFKDAGKRGDERDTLYFNAFTEDLFTWDNDLDGDSERIAKNQCIVPIFRWRRRIGDGEPHSSLPAPLRRLRFQHRLRAVDDQLLP